MNRSAALITVLLLAVSIQFIIDQENGASSGSSEDGPNRSDNDWLLLVYMAADNNLGENRSYGNAAWFDLEEIEGNMTDTGLDVLVLSDMKGDHNTVLYDMEPHPVVGIGSPSIPLSDVNPLWGDELDTSDPDVLRDFLIYGMTNRSADHVMIDIWDHGTGWYALNSRSDGIPDTRGFAQDVTNGGMMYMDDIRDAFAEASAAMGGLHSDVIIFDTCYMGSLEIMYQMSPWADIGIGAEDQQPFYGMNYTFTERMGGIDPLDPVNISKLAVERYSTTYDPTIDPWAGVSATDLRILRTDFITSLDNLSHALYEKMFHLEVDLSGEFYQAYSRAIRIGGKSTLIDLGDLLDVIEARDMDEEITNWAGRALDNYTRMIIDETHFDSGSNPGATGLSVYFPSKYGYYNSIYDGSSGYLNLTADTFWDEMIKEYRDPKERVRINATISSLHPDGVYNDLRIHVTNPQISPDEPIDSARLFIDEVEYGSTDSNGILIVFDLEPDRYDLMALNGTHTGFTTIKMLNQDPIIMIDPHEPWTYEGQPIFIDAINSSDPDGDPIFFEWDLDLSNGFEDVDSTFPGVSLTYNEQGSYAIRLTVSDGMDHVSRNISIDVRNLPPEAVISAPISTREDEEFNVTASDSADTYPDNLNLKYRFSIDDLNVTDWSLLPDTTLTIEHAGEHIIGLWVMDPDGTLDHDQTIIDVFNVRPVPIFTGPNSTEEDESVIFRSSPVMDTPSDQPDLNISWVVNGDQTGIFYGKDFIFNRSISGIYTIAMTVIDDDGAVEITSSQIEVENKAPGAVIQGPMSANESQMIHLTSFGSFDSPSDISSLNYSWDVDDDLEADLYGQTISLSFAENGSHLIMLKVTDDDGAYDLAFLMVTVDNLAPDPVIIAPDRIEEDDRIIISLEEGCDTINDMGSLIYSWEVDGYEIGGDHETLTLIFSTEGNHSIIVTVTDDQGEKGTHILYVNVTNPSPSVIVSGIPSSVLKGEEFTILGYRSHDTESDMGSLRFIWILDGNILSNEVGPNLTISLDKVGTHNISLRVVDDEGAWRQTDPVEFDVEDHELAIKVIGFLLTPVGLLLVSLVLIMIIMAVFQLRKKVKELPAPIREEDQEAEKNDETPDEDEIFDEDGMDEDIDEVDEPYIPAGDMKVGEGEGMEEMDMPEEIDDLPIPGLAPLPDPPDIDELEDFPPIGEDA